MREVVIKFLLDCVDYNESIEETADKIMELFSAKKKQYFVEYKEWQDSKYWQIDGAWIKKSKIVEVENPTEINDMFEHLENIKQIK